MEAGAEAYYIKSEITPATLVRHVVQCCVDEK